MKTQDTQAALDALDTAAGPPGAVACAQNGVDNERMALRHHDLVYAICVMCPATHLEPGVVAASSSPVSGILDLGVYPIEAAAGHVERGRGRPATGPRRSPPRWAPPPSSRWCAPTSCAGSTRSC